VPAPAPSPPCAESRTANDEERAGALKFLHGLASEVSHGSVNLPCFPDVVLRIQKALDAPDAKLGETVRIVGSEPRLTARLLQTANSAVFNRGGRPVTELRTAITRLGTRLVQSAAMAFAVQQMRMAPMLRKVGEPLKEIWEESITVASICQLVARRTTVNAEEAFLTGLMHAIGRLYIMIHAVGRPGQPAFDRSLMEMIDGWHPAIGKAVLENWGFPEAVSEAVANQQDYEWCARLPDHTDILVVSVVLAGWLRNPEAPAPDAESIGSFRRLGLTTEACTKVLHHTEHYLDALHSTLGC
jgi:HD-like signal output (HDOD) protein